ncbi:MAG: hypothetical protein RhofKO_00960 [Rhodothermales bacterium]
MRKITTIVTSITFKVGALIAVLIAVLVYTTLIVQDSLDEMTTSNVIINQAGKLRMLSQKMAKEALYLSMLDSARGDERAEGQAAMLATAAEFEALLTNVTKGNESLGIPTTAARISPEFVQVQQRWQAFHTNVQLLAEAAPQSTVFDSALGDIARTNVPLLQDANTAVSSVQTAAEANKAELMATMKGILLGSVLLFALSIAVLVWVTRPIRVLSAAASSVGEGDYSVQANVKGSGELSQLAMHFNAMVLKVRNNQDAMVAQRDQAQREREHAVQEARESTAAQHRYLADSVETMVTSMKRFSEGDLTVSVPVTSDDAIGTLNTQFNRMVEKTRGVLQRVEQAASLSTEMAEAVNAATEELSAGAHEQAAQASTVASSVEELTLVIVDNADKANQTAAAATASGDAAREGGAVVTQTVAKIHEIAHVVTESAATVERLGASSKEIGEIVAVINEIADQTNLLALNAAIEAARAGEQGRGFAVVADEVRKLAERTSSATRRIAEMIESIQQETTQAVASMARGRDEVADGLQLADRAGQALERIVGEAESVVNLIQSIAASSERQAGSAEQITTNVESIATVAGQSAGAVQEIAQRVNDMQAQVSGLHEVVQAFQLTSEVRSARIYKRAA